MRHILIADLDIDHTHKVAEYLRAAGHHVRVQTDGARAAAVLAEEAPDLLIVGAMMYRCDAWYLYDLLHRSHPENRTLTLLLTGRDAVGEPMLGWRHTWSAWLLGRHFEATIEAVERLLAAPDP